MTMITENHAQSGAGVPDLIADLQARMELAGHWHGVVSRSAVNAASGEIKGVPGAETWANARDNAEVLAGHGAGIALAVWRLAQGIRDPEMQADVIAIGERVRIETAGYHAALKGRVGGTPGAFPIGDRAYGTGNARRGVQLLIDEYVRPFDAVETMVGQALQCLPKVMASASRSLSMPTPDARGIEWHKKEGFAEIVAQRGRGIVRVLTRLADEATEPGQAADLRTLAREVFAETAGYVAEVTRRLAEPGRPDRNVPTTGGAALRKVAAFIAQQQAAAPGFDVG